MFPYWALFSVFALGAVEYRRRGAIGVQSTPFLALGGLIIAVMIGFRFEVGGDWVTYQAIYDEIQLQKLTSALSLSDPSYALINWLAARMGLDIWFVNLACGLIFAWGLVRFARRQTNPWLAILVGIPYLVIVVAMGYTRQGVAIGIILAGLSVIDRTSLFRFGAYVLVAATFHKSAVIVLPLGALAASRNKFVTYGSMLFLGLLVFYFLIVGSMNKLITNYVDAEYASQGAAIRVFMNVVPAAVFLLFQKRFALDEIMRKVWRNFSIAALVSLFLLWWMESSTAVDRLALYLIPLQLFALSRLPEAFPVRAKANGQLVVGVILYSAVIQFVWLNFAQHAELWLPYQLYPMMEETRF